MALREGKIRQDSIDFRDQFYNPDPIPLPDQVLPDPGLINPLDQGQEGACTGFGLAAVINYLNLKEGKKKPVSARMLYEMAKRHDQWPGEDYDGSSCRGAVKGWHKYGVCQQDDWPYDEDNPGFLTQERLESAQETPCGVYYRLRKEPNAIRTALKLCGAVYASAHVHAGWDLLEGEHEIAYGPASERDGAHAFAIVGYDKEGFLVQNSWGKDWGGYPVYGQPVPGLARWRTEDLLDNAMDFWVVQVGLPAPHFAGDPHSGVARSSSGGTLAGSSPTAASIDGHYIHIDDGFFDYQGKFPSHSEIVHDRIKKALAKKPKHLLLYAHGGLNEVEGVAKRVRRWRSAFKRNGIHEIHFMWETGLMEELKDVIKGHDYKVRAGGWLDDLREGFTEFTDNLVEKATRKLGNKVWREMIRDAEVAFQKPTPKQLQELNEQEGLPIKVRELSESFAGWQCLKWIQEEILANGSVTEVHLVGHSAGSIWQGHLLKAWQEVPKVYRSSAVPIENLFLFAPACTHDLFHELIKPAVRNRTVKLLSHYLLDDGRERADSNFLVYRKSLLYLVSRSFQCRRCKEPVPILGMQKHLNGVNLNGIKKFYRQYMTTEDTNWTDSPTHGGFDNDERTMNTMLRTILGESPGTNGFRRQELAD